MADEIIGARKKIERPKSAHSSEYLNLPQTTDNTWKHSIQVNCFHSLGIWVRASEQNTNSIMPPSKAAQAAAAQKQKSTASLQEKKSQIRKNGLIWAAGKYEKNFEGSSIPDRTKDLPRFHLDQVKLGKVLGKGEGHYCCLDIPQIENSTPHKISDSVLLVSAYPISFSHLY